MKESLKYVQWLVFWLSACLPLTMMAATPDFPFTEPEFETIRDVQAIDNQTITALVQDAHGLIWIGTQNGLVRYDGYRFRKFIHKAGDPFSLAGDYIAAVSVARDGRIWNGTQSDGISVFDPATERFEHFRHDEKVPDSLSGDTIFALIGDGRGGMWIATDQGLDHQPAGSKRFVHFKHGFTPHSLLDNKLRSLLLDKAGRLWVGSSSGLQRLAPDGKHFETIIKGHVVQALFQAQDGKLWLGTMDNGAAWLDSANQPQWLPSAEPGYPSIAGFAQVKADQILLGSDGGGIIVVAASDGQVLQTLRHDPTLPGSLTFDTPRTMLVDRAGWLWVGTWSGSLQRMNANNTLMRTLRHSINRPNGLSHPDVHCLLELADGRLLIGTSGNGIDIFDQQRGLIGGFRAERGKPGALPDAKIFALAQTNDGAIWAGTQQAGVVRLLPGSTAWLPVPGLPEKRVRVLLASRDGSLWAGTSGGVARLPPGSPSLATGQNPGTATTTARFEVLADEQGKPMQAAVYALAEDGQGRIWIGTNKGLWLQEPNRRGLIHIPAEPTRPDGLISDYIASLLFDSRGSLWLSTGKGLERLKSRDGKLARFQHAKDLMSEGELSEDLLNGNLLEDHQGRIWSNGAVIDQITPAAIRARMNGIIQADGIDIKTGWLGSFAKTRRGLLLFGGTQGVMIIDPAGFKPYQYVPELMVTELKINGKVVPPGVLANPAAQTASGGTASLILSATQRNFAIEFSALDYSEPQKNNYQYRLQGYDKDWINTDAEHRSAAYGNLWPGVYTLQVRGSNRLGKWSPHELLIPIRILPAWWQTWWFALVLLMMMGSLLAALVQVRTRYLRQRQRALEQLVHVRTSELRHKQTELVDANHELNESNSALNEANSALNEAIEDLNESNEALNQSNEALNTANADLVLSVETLRQLGDIGREITANLDAEIVFKSLHLYVGGLLNAPTMTIYRINAATRSLDAVFGRDDDQAMPMRNVSLDSPTSNAARAVRERQELLLHYDPQDDPTHIPGTRHMLTALFAPLIVDDKVLGVMSIQSDKKNAWDERERLIFRTLTAYGAIALANATVLAALRQAQGQLVQQEKMASLGGLVQGIAHEINTPLGTTLMAISGVEGAWQTLQDAVVSGRLSQSLLESSTAEGMEYTALALKTANRAAELIALFKTIAVDADSDRVAEIELADYLPEVVTLVHTQLVQNGNKLEIAIPAGLALQVVPDALTEALSRILVNVLNHAFTDGRTGTLRISAQAGEGDGGEEVIISISDDGHGIAPEDLPKVFDPFFTTKSGMHGHVGLGLHVAYNHVTQRLKGQIQVTSTMGEGTCVAIRLKKG